MKNILVVDDDLAMRNMLVDYLSQHSFRTSAVENSQQLAHHLSSEVPDLVIVDMNLGHEDGLQIVRALNNKMDIPIIIISGDRLDESDKVTPSERAGQITDESIRLRAPVNFWETRRR